MNQNTKLPNIEYTQSESNASTSQETKPVKQMDLNNLPPLLTIKEASEILRVSPLTLKRWGKRGRLVPIRINSRGDRRYKKEAILWMLGITPK